MWPLKKKIFRVKRQQSDEQILNEIEKLFDRIKEMEITVSQTEEQNELIISNLIVAYYLNKLERKLN